MAFIDIQFPKRISFNSVGGPGFAVDVIVTGGGQEYRNQTNELERSEYEVDHAARLPDIWKPLQAFFRVMAGRANSFRLHDPTDYSATAAEGVFAMIDATHFQMRKKYLFGAQIAYRTITKPITPSVTVGGIVASIDYSTGIVTMTSGTPTTWSGEFDVHCRFDTNQMRHITKNKTPNGEFIVGWDSIPIVELKTAT